MKSSQHVCAVVTVNCKTDPQIDNYSRFLVVYLGLHTRLTLHISQPRAQIRPKAPGEQFAQGPQWGK